MKTFSQFAVATLSAASLACVVFAKDQGVGAPVDPATLASTPTVDHVVYLAHLPAPADLSKAASSQGSSIVRMDETADHIVVVYQYTSGKTVTFAYTLLSTAPMAPTENLHAESIPAETHQMTTTMVAQPSSTVVYTSAPAPAYYYSSGYYSPFWNFWAPLAVGIGLSYAWYGGGYYYHGGGHYHGGGDWHGGGGYHGGGGHH